MIVDDAGNEYFLFDDHCHMAFRSNSSLGYKSFDAEQMIADMDACGVDMVVGFSMGNPHTDYRAQNEQILGFMTAHPDRIVAFARIQPLFMEKAVADVREYALRGVKGLKFNPFMDGGGTAVNSREVMFPLMEEASKHRLTVLIHSGESWNTAPSLIGDLADHFPDVSFIIGHSGLWEFHEQAIATARRVPNVFLDTTEVAPPVVVTSAVRGVGAHRVLYGSDHPYIPFGFEIGKVAKYAGLKPPEIRQVLGENLARILRMPIKREGRHAVKLSSI